MLYHSTRDKNRKFTSKQAILKGICEDGGLFVSDELGETRFPIEKLQDLSYEQIAETVMQQLLPDYSGRELEDCIEKAYRGKFETGELTPLTKIGDQYLLELYHGPTQAFKDMALCMLPQLMSRALEESDQKVMILTATSGDTGKAALSGFADTPNIGIAVFFPHEKVSDIQYLQMVTQKGKNVYVAAVKGNFDDCQTGVKNVFMNASDQISKTDGVSLSSANSINVGRLVPQVVYYFEAYKQLLRRGRIKLNDPVDFCVPTGNFGDILAGYYAKCLGLPVGKLIIASNENKVLYDFLKTGTYDRNRSFVKTISPSMDILISSNLERLLYYASGKDEKQVAQWMMQLKEKGTFTVPDSIMSKIREVFDYGYANEQEVKAAIKDAYERFGRLIDPHTAVAFRVAAGRKNPTVILSTASPFKFAKDVYTSIFGEPAADFGDGFAYMEELSHRTGQAVPKALGALKDAKILHRDVIGIDEMEAAVRKSVKEKVNGSD